MFCPRTKLLLQMSGLQYFRPMQSFTHIPQPPLNNFVDLFWFYDGYSPRTSTAKERLMPDGSVELVINLKQDEAIQE